MDNCAEQLMSLVCKCLLHYNPYILTVKLSQRPFERTLKGKLNIFKNLNSILGKRASHHKIKKNT